jgi:ribosome biogenesis GTPase A
MSNSNLPLDHSKSTQFNTMTTLTAPSMSVIPRESNTSQVLGDRLRKRFEELRNLYTETILLTVKKIATDDQINLLRDKLAQLELAALYVIVGEVKTGKSSCINALFGEEICPVDAGPCTETIQEMVYGVERDRKQLGEKWERLTLPHEVLRGITVVDTPGTNSIERHHQAITEGYLPQCDVAIFVLPAMNPHTASAWDLLERIRRDYRHRVVFVLQQSDLPTSEMLQKNIELVRKYARKHGVTDPQIFPVSALREMQGEDDSGYDEFRKYLRTAVETGEVWRIKFDGACGVLERVMNEVMADLGQKKKSLKDDLAFIDRLEAIVSDRKRNIDGLRSLVLDSLLGTYDGLTGKLAWDFQSGLNMGTVCRRSIPFVRDTTIKDWLHKLEKDFKEEASKRIDNDAQRNCQQLQSAINDMVDEIESSIKSHHDVDNGAFPALMADRNAILSDLADGLNGDSLLQGLDRGLPAGIQIEGNIQGGSAMLAIGGVVALLTKLAIFDITGGILAGLGALLIGLTLLWKRSAIIANMEREIKAGRNDFQQEIDRSMGALFDGLFYKADQSLISARQRLNQSLDTLEPTIQDVADLQRKLFLLRGDCDQ